MFAVSSASEAFAQIASGNSCTTAGTIAVSGSAPSILACSGSSFLTALTINAANGYISVGTTSTPQALLDINGGLRVGNDTGGCSSTNAGEIKYASSQLSYCNSSAWTALSAVANPSIGCGHSGTVKGAQIVPLTVAAGCTVTFKAWGGGGGGGNGSGANGGGGGYATITLGPLGSATTYYLAVGGGGIGSGGNNCGAPGEGLLNYEGGSGSISSTSCFGGGGGGASVVYALTGDYTTGTASQSITTVTGSGTTWTSSMVGSMLVFANGISAGEITAFGSATSLTVSTSQTVSSQNYSIYPVSLVAAGGGGGGTYSAGAGAGGGTVIVAYYNTSSTGASGVTKSGGGGAGYPYGSIGGTTAPGSQAYGAYGGQNYAASGGSVTSGGTPAAGNNGDTNYPAGYGIGGSACCGNGTDGAIYYSD
jgi:hypothetical protein